MQQSGSASSNSPNTYVGALFIFTERGIYSRVGVSWTSNEKACQNLQDEIPAGSEFCAAVANTKDAWNSGVLSTVTITTSISA